MLHWTNFRTDARRHLRRFQEEFASCDNNRLKYAVLELRMAMEALTYARAMAYKKEFPPQEYGTWQPQKVMTVLLNFDPMADRNTCLAYGREEEGRPPREWKRARLRDSPQYGGLEKALSRPRELSPCPEYETGSGRNTP